MSKESVTKLIKGIKNGLSKHSPEILTGIGIAGMATTVVLAVRATPVAMEIITDIPLEDDQDKPTVKQVVKAAWKPYVPAAVLGVTSAACLIGANSVNTKRNAALATAYQLSRTALSEYKEKVVEVVGEKKEQKIREEIAKDKIEAAPIATKEVFITEKGNTLCYDVMSGRYFKSDRDMINREVNQLNKRLMDEMYISLNEYYYALGLQQTKLGNEMGWNINDGLIEISFTAQVAENGEPCLVVDYYVAPRYGFDKLG